MASAGMSPFAAILIGLIEARGWLAGWLADAIVDFAFDSLNPCEAGIGTETPHLVDNRVTQLKLG